MWQYLKFKQRHHQRLIYIKQKQPLLPLLNHQQLLKLPNLLQLVVKHPKNLLKNNLKNQLKNSLKNNQKNSQKNNQKMKENVKVGNIWMLKRNANQQDALMFHFVNFVTKIINALVAKQNINYKPINPVCQKMTVLNLIPKINVWNAQKKRRNAIQIIVMLFPLLIMANVNKYINYALLKSKIVLFVLKRINVLYVNRVIRFWMENAN